ncbi:MAG TPA: GAF domain-containing protein [Anaerolineae bacterium]|nr:GAF domain-containing protein [Anaerolineae bacterium]
MSKRDLKQRLDELFTSPDKPAPSRDAGMSPAAQAEPGAPRPDAGERAHRNAALLTEIAELKQAQAERQASERRFRDMVENAHDLIQSVAPDGSILYANRAWREALGYGEAEWPGLSVFAVIHPDSRPHYVQIFQRVISGEALARVEAKLLAKDGRTLRVDGASSCRFEDGQPVATLSIFRDVTERQGAEAALSRRALQLQTAADVSRAASSILNGDELLASTVDLIRGRFNLYYVGLFLVDEARQYAVLRAGTGEAGRTMIERGHRLAVGGASMIGWCVANRRARIALDVGQDATRFDNPLLPETRSELALPLIARGEVLGAMTVQSTQAEAFSEIDIAVLQTMTDQVANAIANARLFEQARQQLAELSAVSAISRVLASRLGLNSLIELTVDTIRETFGVNNAYIAVYDSRTHTVRIPCMVEDDQKLSIEPFPLGQGLTSAIIQSRQPLLIDQDVERRLAELGARQTGAPAKSFLGVPMIVGDEVIGAICIQDTRRPDLFGEDELRLLTTLAPSVGIAIQNARLFEQTQAALAESRRLARRAELVNRITGKIRAAVSVDDVLHIAVDELRQATRSTHALARLDAPGRTHGNGQHDSGPQGVAHE